MAYDEWLIRHSEVRSDFKLVCFPWAGASASVYRSWARLIGDQVELWAVELPGHGRRLDEEPLTQLAQIVAHVAEAIGSMGARDLAFFGHSLGGLVAFETAHHQRLHDFRQPSVLMVSGCPAPRYVSTIATTDLDDDAALMARLGQLQGTPAEVLSAGSLLKYYLPAIRADFGLVSAYEPQQRAPLSMPLVTLHGETDELAPSKLVGAWATEAVCHSEQRAFAGGHFFVKEQEAAVAAFVRETLERSIRR